VTARGSLFWIRYRKPGWPVSSAWRRTPSCSVWTRPWRSISVI